jgi:hypothetical protein
MMFVGATLTQCLRAVGVYAPNCNWTSNPLGTGVTIGGFVLVAVGVWAMFFQRPPQTGKTDPSVPDENGFYPLRNQVGGSPGHGPVGYLDFWRNKRDSGRVRSLDLTDAGS